jgi:hypothetical protein
MSDLPPVPPSPAPAKGPVAAGRLVLGLVLVLLGLGWLLEATGALELDWALVWPVVLILVGVALVVAAWQGRARGGLVALGVVLTLLLALGTLEMPLTGGVGDRVERPRSLGEIPRRYELAVGKLTVDLGGLRWSAAEVPGSVRVRAGVGMGELLVLVGEGFPCISVRARSGLGDVVVFGERASGISPEYRTEATCLVAPVLELDLSVGLGKVEVRRG